MNALCVYIYYLVIGEASILGPVSTLEINKLEIDNGLYIDHSNLFLPSDIEQIPYYYANDVIEIQEGLSRSLGSIRYRLDLLGYSPRNLESIYRKHIANMLDYYPALVSFEQFKSVVSHIDIGKIDSAHGNYSLSKFVNCYIFRDLEIKWHLPADIYLDTFFESIDPYLVLRLLAENPANLAYLVQWKYADVVEGGYVNRDEVVNRPLPPEAKILIVTEGSSDTFIIQRTMNKLKPDIADFFHFVDMKKQYPFTGAGNLFNFCQGLTSIHIQNKVLVLFDNDVAGIESLAKCQNLRCPSNMHFCKLPNHIEFSQFKTIGPNGKSLENINGSAVAIECFLDLSKVATVRWTSYNRNFKRYQGKLEDKDIYVRKFKKSSLDGDNYNTGKLEFLLDYIFDEWIKNAGYKPLW